MSPVTGGQLAARTLSAFGVGTVFGVHGGHLDAFLVECDHLGIRIVDHRHEAAAGNAAEGYTRATGGSDVTFGRGMAIGAQVAFPDRPVVLATGDGGVGFHLQEFDDLTLAVETAQRERRPAGIDVEVVHPIMADLAEGAIRVPCCEAIPRDEI